MPTLELELVPASKDPDAVMDRDEEAIAFFPQLWEPSYSVQFRYIVRQSIQYGWEEIRNNMDDDGPVSKAGKDVIITMKRVTDGYVHLRGDYRYDSTDLARVLVETKYDLLPPYVGVSRHGQHLLDGHHRWRAYKMAGIAPLVMQIQVENSTGSTPKIICEYDNSIYEKTIIDKEQHDDFVKFLQKGKDESNEEIKEQMTVAELRSLISEMLSS